MSTLRYGSSHGSWKFTKVALIAAGLLAIASGTASATLQENLGSFHLGFDLGVAPQLDSSGNLLTLMDIGDSTYLEKFSPDGNTVWAVLMPQPFLHSGCHLLVDGSDNVYVNTWEDVRTTPTIVIVTKFNASGTVVWGPTSYAIDVPNTSEHAQPGPMALGSDGSLYVVGRSGQNFANPQPATLLRINPSTGAERNRRSEVNVLGQVAPGAPVLAATTDLETPGMGSTVLATDSAGNVYYGGPQGLWSFSQDLQTQRWNRSLMPRAFAVDSVNGALYVTGVGSAGTLTFNMFVARLSTASGATVWSWSTANESFPRGYGTMTGSELVEDREFGGNKILLDSTGQVYAAGHGLDGSYSGGIIVKFPPSGGTNSWRQHYGPTGSRASVYGFAIDNMNDLYVAGVTTGAGQSGQILADLEILSPAGSQLWLNSQFEIAGRNYTYEGIDDVVVDRNGRSYWKISYDSSDQGSGEDLYSFIGNALPDGVYTIVGLNSGMAVDDPGSSGSAGKQMDQWTVNNGANQKWTVTNVGNNTVRLVNQANGLSLGVRSNSKTNGAAVEQNVWTGAASQQWVVASTGTLGYFTLKNLNSGQMLDVVGASKTAGALLDQWPTSGGANQQWHLQ